MLIVLVTAKVTEMNISFVDIIDYVGTFAFAISGIRFASKKNYDLFGALIVGFVTAVGGGTLRDIMLGKTPFWFTQNSYIIITILALIFFVIFQKHISKLGKALFLFDTIGIALFTVVGFHKTIECGFSLWVATLMGMFTGAAGGVIRDILLNEVPLIFRRDIYALACWFGGLVYLIGIKLNIPELVTQIACAATVVAIRICAVTYHWRMFILRGHRRPAIAK